MIAYILIILGIMMRLVPHAANMAPIAAISLFAGAYLNKKIVPWVPLAIMVVTDLIIGMHDTVLYVWGAFVVVGFIGMWLKERRSAGNILGATVASALIFFVITNFGVWVAWYPHTFQGFVDCYIKAVPFLRNTLVSNILFGAVLFGGYELLRHMMKASEVRKVLIAE